MFVSDWMTKKVITVSPDDFISDAVKVIKEHGIKHIPVVKDGKLKGIISDRDIRDYVPSKASSLDVYELHYLLQSTKIKTIMNKKTITAKPDTPVEEAAMILHDEGIGCMPVMEGRKMVGIISDYDIFRALIDISGVRHGGNRVSVMIRDRPGSIKDVADIVRAHGFRLQGIMTSYEGTGKGKRKVVIRTKGNGRLKGLKEELESLYRDVDVR
jgi:acetoin utilization protein AcuB